ncbi:helix-turn-helix domain-containing protein [Ohtaekwangia koreensis]|nr:helix-turn-helix domain-containing protein [Ohtaekwangia koreensis]
MIKRSVFKSNLKTLGLMRANDQSLDAINDDFYKPYIKVLYLPKGYSLTVDFNTFTTKQSTLFFISPNQFLQINLAGPDSGYFIFYNRDFYCIQIHDEEVACDGLLFNNIANMPMTTLTKDEDSSIKYLFDQIEFEFSLKDATHEEMIRTYLKQLFIKSARQWKKQHLGKIVAQQHNELEFFRKFTRLVEEHYKYKHSVSDYAEILSMASKTITHRFKRLNLLQPNEIIKNRLVLEAKRLLVHTSMTAKEIAFELGYEDPAYFSRQFMIKTGKSPSSFRAKFLGQNAEATT